MICSTVVAIPYTISITFQEILSETAERLFIKGSQHFVALQRSCTDSTTYCNEYSLSRVLTFKREIVFETVTLVKFLNTQKVKCDNLVVYRPQSHIVPHLV